MSDPSFYQQKPVLQQEKKPGNSTLMTLFSLLLFILSYALFVQQDLIFIFLIVGVLFLHEFGHFAFMKIFRYENVRMLFVPLMGAFVHGKKESYNQWEQVLVILAGPIPGIIVGSVLWYYGFTGNIPVLKSASTILLVLNAINLLPVQPLDGGRLLQTLFLTKSSLLPVVFTLLSSLSLIAIGYYMEWYVLMGVGFFMSFQVRNQYRAYLIHKALREQNVNYTGTYDELSNGDYHFIKLEMLANTPGLRKYLDLSDDPDADQMVAQEVNLLLDPAVKLNVGILSKVVLCLVWLAALTLPTYLLLQSKF
jgi:stage IV sporulation protein FB